MFNRSKTVRAAGPLLAAVALSALVACSGGKDAAETETSPDAEAAAADADVSEASDAAAMAAAAAEFTATAETNAVASAAFLAENAKREGVVVTESGLQYQVLEKGPETGAAPLPTDVVDVHYVGTLIDGMEFDSSRARGAAARFQANQVIEGWIEGLQLMREGDKMRLYVPSELAYGETGTPGGPIGPNQALIFDVELLRVNNPDRNLAAAEAYLAENRTKDGVSETESGLQYKVLASGPADGATPNEANVVRVQYEGRLLNGTVFDSSYARGEAAEFPLGRVIPGWIEGVQLMKVGDKFQFYIKPELAYGARGTPGGPIGPNELLVFDVELLEVKE